jgi:hypothetical protein
MCLPCALRAGKTRQEKYHVDKQKFHLKRAAFYSTLRGWPNNTPDVVALWGSDLPVKYARPTGRKPGEGIAGQAVCPSGFGFQFGGAISPTAT